MGHLHHGVFKALAHLTRAVILKLEVADDAMALYDILCRHTWSDENDLRMNATSKIVRPEVNALVWSHDKDVETLSSALRLKRRKSAKAKV